MIKPIRDNILVKEIVKDSKAGNLIINQDESSSYMFVKVEDISYEALFDLNDAINDTLDNLECDLLNGKYLLVISRIAKFPFVQDKFFISVKDIRAIIDKKEFEEL